jgi:hypothetical protein
MRAYHMSSRIHPVGTILTGNGRPKVAPDIEAELERLRPAACVSRLDSVYSRETPDFRMLGLDNGYVYRIVIHGDCQRHDARWIGFLQQAHLKRKHTRSHQSIAVQWPDWTDMFVALACTNYWTAVKSDEPLWELLSNEAEVEAQLSDVPINAECTKGGWRPADGA